MNKIGFRTALALVVGNIIGAGIFTTGGYLAAKINQPRLILLAWLLGGIYALSGAFVYAVLAKEMPENGGDYIYLKRNYPPYFAYLFGWSGLFITYTGSIAALAIGAAHYLNVLLPFLNLKQSIFTFSFFSFTVSLNGLRFSALLLILLFTYINHLGLRSGGGMQLLLAFGIMLLLGSFIAAGLAGGATTLIRPLRPAGANTTIFFTALPAVLFTYMGWTTVVYLAAEVRKPGKTIPLALVSGVLMVTLLYLGLNYVLFSALPASALAGQINAVSRVAQTLWGAAAAKVVAFMVIVAVLSSMNSTILSGPRIYRAMAADGYLWKSLTRLHKDQQTPYRALWLQALWAVALLFSGTFNQLLTMVVAAVLIFSVLSAGVGVKILTRGLINPWYWLPTIIYIVLCLLVLFFILLQNGTQSILGFLLLLLSAPFYLWQKHK